MVKTLSPCLFFTPAYSIRINSGSCYLLAAYKYTDVLLDSLQGFVVAITFCYRNGEVRDGKIKTPFIVHRDFL